jgi:hypothetical protein
MYQEHNRTTGELHSCEQNIAVSKTKARDSFVSEKLFDSYGITSHPAADLVSALAPRPFTGPVVRRCAPIHKILNASDPLWLWRTTLITVSGPSALIWLQIVHYVAADVSNIATNGGVNADIVLRTVHAHCDEGQLASCKDTSLSRKSNLRG